MRILILALLILFTNSAVAKKWPVWPQIQIVDPKLGWSISQKNIVGSTSRVELYGGQDPFPFCASFAASILHDQHECMTNKTSCQQQPRTSALSLVMASQGGTNKINWNSGGEAIQALHKIVLQGGAAAHSKCNYDFITDRRNSKNSEFSKLYGIYNSYRTLEKWGGYLTRYWRDEFILDSKSLGLPTPDISDLVSKKFNTVEALTTALILNPDCDVVSIYSSKKYQINSVKNPSMNIELVYNQINKLLKLNTPIMLNLCLNAHVGFTACSKHTLVITAQGSAMNKTTGDVRTAYKIANTWGEDWHKAHNDGWVFADTLLEGVYEIIWLE